MKVYQGRAQVAAHLWVAQRGGAVREGSRGAQSGAGRRSGRPRVCYWWARQRASAARAGVVCPRVRHGPPSGGRGSPGFASRWVSRRNRRPRPAFVYPNRSRGELRCCECRVHGSGQVCWRLPVQTEGSGSFPGVKSVNLEFVLRRLVSNEAIKKGKTEVLRVNLYYIFSVKRPCGLKS